MKQKKSKKRGRVRTIAAILAALLLVCCAAAALLYRDRLTPDALRGMFAGGGETDETSEPFTYEVGSGQVFAVSGNRLAVASPTGIQLLSDKGYTVVREVFSMDRPAIAVSEKYCVFYDAGGRELRYVNAKNESVRLDMGETAILSASVNDSGYLTVITEETGYKAVVTVYDSTLHRVFAWHSGSAYVHAAQVSPNDRTLAALCTDTSGGRLQLFTLGSEEPSGSFASAGELFWDLRWLGRDTVCVLTEERLIFLDDGAQMTGEYAFADRWLLDYGFGDGFASVLLGEHRSGGSSLLVTVGANGREKSSAELHQKDVLTLSAGSDRVLTLCADELTLYTDMLSPLGSTQETLGAKKALLRRDGKCLLLSAYSAELLNLY